MPPFQIRLRSTGVQRELDSLIEADYERVSAKLKSLADNPIPQGVEKLVDSIYRVRVGEIRIIYLVDNNNKRVEIGAVRHRNERTYRKINKLFK